MKEGIFYGVSVGPGDPELMTRKAVRVIEECGVIVAPMTKGEKTLALDITRGAADLSRKEIVPVEFLMTRDREAQRQRHMEIAEQIAGYLRGGQDVAMLNLGDVSIYSTFSYIHQLIVQQGFETEIIPGVTSFCAVAAKLKTSLTTMAEPLTIIPASHGQTEAALATPGTKVLMKAGRALGEVKEALQQAGLYGRAMLVKNCGLPEEQVCRNMDEAGDDMGYFATIVVGGEKE